MSAGEPVHDAGQRVTNRMCRGPHVDAYVIVHGLDPINVGGGNEHDASVSANREAWRLGGGGAAGGRHVGDQRGESGDVCAAGLRRRSGEAFCARDGGEEPVFFDGLEQVIHRVHRERLEGVGIVRRDEDDEGHPLDAHCPHDVESVELGHLDIEEDEIGQVAGDGGHGTHAVAAFTGDDHGGVLGEQRSRDGRARGARHQL